MCPLIAIILAIPASFGRLILGDNWQASKNVLPMVAAELFFAILATITFAGHRVERAGVRALVIRVIRAPFQIGVVVIFALNFGAQGAATAMAAMSLVGAASWWLSYRNLLASAAMPSKASTPTRSATALRGRVRSRRPLSESIEQISGPATAQGMPQKPRFRAQSSQLSARSSSAAVATEEDAGGTHADRPPWIRRFPVTSLLALQYIALAVWPAWLHHDDAAGFITWIVGTGVIATFLGELIAKIEIRRTPAKGRTFRVTPRAATTITVVGFVALYGSALLGARTFATQLGSTAVNPLARLATPFIPWALVGSGLILCCWVSGTLSRGATLIRLGYATVAYLGYALLIHITAPFAEFVLALTLGALITRLIRIRWLAVGILAALAIWPVVYNLRNASRENLVRIGPYGQTITASQRLREDLLLQPASEYPAPMGIPATTLLQAVHYGVIPSVLDPFPRPDLRTAKELSIATGGSSTNSLTFTLLGNIRAVGGTGTLVLAMGFVGFVVARLARRTTPMRLITVMACAQSVMWIESIYPDNIAAVLQTVVSGFLALLLIAAQRELVR